LIVFCGKPLAVDHAFARYDSGAGVADCAVAVGAIDAASNDKASGNVAPRRDVQMERICMLRFCAYDALSAM
jgi:hypothetical protein